MSASILHLSLDYLALTRVNIARTKQRIARQREIVDALSQKGYSTRQATRLLENLTGTLRAYEAILHRRKG